MKRIVKQGCTAELKEQTVKRVSEVGSVSRVWKAENCGNLTSRAGHED